jgi:hypothetical protein
MWGRKPSALLNHTSLPCRPDLLRSCSILIPSCIPFLEEYILNEGASDSPFLRQGIWERTVHTERELTQSHRVSILSSEERSLGRPTLRCGAEVRWAAEGRHLSQAYPLSTIIPSQCHQTSSNHKGARENQKPKTKGGGLRVFRITSKGSLMFAGPLVVQLVP